MVVGVFLLFTAAAGVDHAAGAILRTAAEAVLMLIEARLFLIAVVAPDIVKSGVNIGDRELGAREGPEAWGLA